jgi:hypothetical protein
MMGAEYSPDVRLIGILALIAGLTGTVHATRAAFRAPRPLDLVWAVVAPAAAILAIVGLVTIVSPGFLAD